MILDIAALSSSMVVVAIGILAYLGKSKPPPILWLIISAMAFLHAIYPLTDIIVWLLTRNEEVIKEAATWVL